MGEIEIQATADVDGRAVLGPGTTVWHLAQIREDARLGRDCIVGRGAYVGPGVTIGDHVKLQNYALVYEPARLEDGVFIGPAAVLTNDLYPRSTDVAGKLKRPDDWEARGVVVREGASLGANVTVIAGVRDRPLGAGRGRGGRDRGRAGLRPGGRGSRAADRLGGPGRRPAPAGGRGTVAVPGDGRALRRGRRRSAAGHGRGMTSAPRGPPGGHNGDDKRAAVAQAVTNG